MKGQAAIVSCLFCSTLRKQQQQHSRVWIEKTKTNILRLSEHDNRLDVVEGVSLIEERHVEQNVTTTTTTTNTTTISAALLLNVVAVLWGSQHAIMKQVMDTSDASLFTLLRFSVAAVLASPFTPGLFSTSEKDKNTAQQTWRWGLEMGLWMFLGFAFQAIGLETTTAQRSGFLLYLNVKLVPFLALILLGRTIQQQTLLSAVAAFAGTALLATDGSTSAGLYDFCVGDAWSIAAATASAMFILRLERASAQITNAAQFNAASLWTVAALSALWTLANNMNNNDDLAQALWETGTTHIWEIVYLGGIATALTNWIQSKAQKGISAERAAVIYAMDPVYGAVFSSLLLGETLGGTQAWIGAAMIAVAAATNAFWSNGSEEPDDATKR